MRPNTRSCFVEVLVAFFGALGLIGAAIFSNWDKIVHRDPSPTTPISPPPTTPISPSPTISDPPPPPPPPGTLYTSEVKSVIQHSLILGHEAYWNLDASLLEEVFTGEAFKILQGSIEVFRADDIKAKTQSENIQYSSISFTENPLRAEVRFTRSLRVYQFSIKTGQCVKSTPEYLQDLTYNLEHQAGKWKIFAIEIHTPTPESQPTCE